MTRLLSYVTRHSVKQPAPGLCGPIALRNALLRYERFSPEQVLKACPASQRNGCNEHTLARGARRLGYTLQPFNCSTPGLCRAQIRWWIRRNVPILVCVEKWEHWIAIVHSTSRRVFICDSSNNDRATLEPMSWNRFLSRAVYTTVTHKNGIATRFDLYGVVRI